MYNKVVSLEFIDDPDIFISPNNNLWIKDIKNFIELLLAKGAEI